MSMTTGNIIKSRLQRIGAVGSTLAKGVLLIAQAATIHPLAVSAFSMGTATKLQCSPVQCTDALLPHIDHDHNRRISRTEFEAFTASRTVDFDVIDTNHDGYIC